MGIKQPSKYLSLSRLLEIKENNYYLKYDYIPEEVDRLIWVKQQKIFDKQVKDVSIVTEKRCSLCKKIKLLEEFHIDKSKTLKRRSHCKSCRKPVPF